MKKLEIDNLIIEITRRCNMECEHCLRGDAECTDIDEKFIDKILEDIEHIRTLTFTGGEISLHPMPILYTLQKCKELNITVDSIYCVTNAMLYNQDLMNYLILWQEYILQENNNYHSDCINGDWLEDYERDIKPMFDFTPYDMRPVTLAISFDEYHEDIPLKNLYKLSCYSFTNFNDKCLKRGATLIAEGRLAGETHNTRPLSIADSMEFEEFEDKLLVKEIYLNAIGRITKNCDLSYTHQLTEKFGNLNQESLLEIINRNLHKGYQSVS